MKGNALSIDVLLRHVSAKFRGTGWPVASAVDVVRQWYAFKIACLNVSTITSRHITGEQQWTKSDHTMVMRNFHPSEASIVHVIVDPLVRDLVAPLIGRKFSACSFVSTSGTPRDQTLRDRKCWLSCRIFHSFLSSPIQRHAYRTMPSNRFLYHLTVSFWLTRWEAPILLWHRLRLATRSPGRVMQT